MCLTVAEITPQCSLPPPQHVPALAPRSAVPGLCASGLRDLPHGQEVVGPVICLGAVERRKVAAVLAMQAGADGQFMVVVIGREAGRLARERLLALGVTDMSIMDLQARGQGRGQGWGALLGARCLGPSRWGSQACPSWTCRGTGAG